MKKLLLFATALCLSLSSMAIPSKKAFTQGTMLPLEAPVTIGNGMKKAPSRADEGDYTIRFCDEISSWYSLVSSVALGVKYEAYIYVTPDVATKLAGNKIVDLTFSAYLGFDSKGNPAQKSGSIFVAEDMEVGPVVSQAITVVSANPDAFVPQTEKFDNPYTIKAGQGFYLGYTVEKCTNKEYPVGVSSDGGNAFSGYATAYNAKGAVLNSASLEQNGCSLYLYAKTVGANKSLDDFLMVDEVMLDYYELPTLNAGERSNMVIYASNFGSNDITSIDCQYTVNGIASAAETVPVNIKPGEQKGFAISTPVLPEGRCNINFAIKGVNSSSFDSSYDMAAIAVAEKDQVQRAFVCEEGTGTWCGWCPFGIESFEYMNATYPDNFIGIAVHASSSTPDPFEVESYLPLAMALPGFPYCVFNRDASWILQPLLPNFEELYPEYWADAKAAAKVDVKAYYSAEEGLSATAYTTFNFNQDNAEYYLAFAITEDGLEGVQHNYFSGMTPAVAEANGIPCVPEGWDTAGEDVDWVYNDVARDIVDCWGIDGSVPTKIVKGQKYSYTSALPTDHITDITKTKVVAMLLDGETGVIINAAKVGAEKYQSGVDDIHVDAASDAKAVYYNLMGVQMPKDRMESGVYIKVAGNKATKVYVK